MSVPISHKRTKSAGCSIGALPSGPVVLIVLLLPVGYAVGAFLLVSWTAQVATRHDGPSLANRLARIPIRVGVESLLFLGGCLVGLCLWWAAAIYYEGTSDLYWTANGHPPPSGEYSAGSMLPYLLVPYTVVVALRALALTNRRMRPETPRPHDHVWSLSR